MTVDLPPQWVGRVVACRTTLRFIWWPLVAWVTVIGTSSLSAGESMSIEQTDQGITIKQGEAVVLTYVKVAPKAPAGMDPVFERSGCLHPVQSPAGRTVTTMFPADHAHQHGIFTAWVNTTYDGQPVDFWNLAGRTGRVLHERVVSTFQEGKSAGFEVDLIHRAEESKVDVLRERWKVTGYATDGPYHQFDLETTQTALTDKPLIVNKYHYGGVALRGPVRWLNDADGYARQHPELTREATGFLNDLGSDRAEGNHEHARWVALWGLIDDQPVSIAVLCHADNFRAPQAARLHPTKPYFCYAPCVDASFTIDREHPFKSRYRFLVTDARPDPEWLTQQWALWCGQSQDLP